MKLGLVSDTHIGPPSENLRNTNAESFLHQLFISSEWQAEKLDAIIHLGDHIQHDQEESDALSFKRILGYDSEAPCPVFHVLGNHDQVSLSESRLEALLEQDSLYFSADISNHHLVFLFTKTSIPGAFVPAHIPSAQLAWLKNDLSQTDLPTVIVSHYPIVEQDIDANHWFGSRRDCAFVSNRAEVLEIVRSHNNVRAFLNGHLHQNSMASISNIPAFTVQSAVEFKNPGLGPYPAHASGIFSISESEIVLRISGRDPAEFRHPLS